MAYTKRAFCFLAVLTFAGYLLDSANVASAQGPPYVAVTPDSLRAWAEKLRQDLQDGSIMFADVDAIQLQLALHGRLSEEMSAKVSALELRGDPDKPEPQLTAGFVPVADKLIQALDDPKLGVAKKYSEQLAAQIHAQYGLYLQKQVESVKTGDTDVDRYFNLSRQIHESLRKGDV